jgi:hypothetical protein
MLWTPYKRAVAKFTYAMEEVGPGVATRHNKAPQVSMRAALLFFLAGAIILGFALFVAVQNTHR